MKRNALAVVALLVMFPAFSMAADQPSFEGGEEEAIAVLVAPGYEDTLYLEVPAGYYVTNATMKVTGMAAENETTTYPENIKIELDKSSIWEFRQNGFGPMGHQNQFSTGQKSVTASFVSGGGVKTQFIRLPKNAIVESATMDIQGCPPTSGHELVNISGSGNRDNFGKSVSNAGDVNGDGFNDIIIGAPNNDAGGTDAGRAYIYYGGPNMDNTADVTITGGPSLDRLGYIVAGGGDVNNDGYDDVLVTAWANDYVNIYFGGQNMDNVADLVISNGIVDEGLGYALSCMGDINNDGIDDVVVGALYNNVNHGLVYVYYGGQHMNNISDVILLGDASEYYFGSSVSSSIDLNNDGYDDVIVGATNAGKVYAFFGNKTMDSQADMIFTGGSSFGGSVRNAGDFNNDGYEDLIVGAANNNRAYLFLGGSNMDNASDIIFNGMNNSFFGYSVSAAGNLNHDNSSDIIIGAYVDDSNGMDFGGAYVFFGGNSTDNITDVCYYGYAQNCFYGYSVSGAGDVNGDGYDEILIGAPNNYSLNDNGHAYIYTLQVTNLTGILNPGLTMGSKNIWNANGYFNETIQLGDFANDLNSYLQSHSSSGNDSYGNNYLDVPIIINASDSGSLSLSKLKITYSYVATTPEFSSVLGKFLTTNQNDTDTSGKIKVPFHIRASSAGRIKLSGIDIDISLDLAPSLVVKIGDFELLEDSWNSSLTDLYTYFQDDIDPDTLLEFSITSRTNSSYVTVGIRNRRYLAADVLAGDINDNWTGTVEVVIACADHWGQKTESNQFTIIVKNVNDEPIITSMPVYYAEAGVPYYYNLTTVDGDNDKLQFSLPKCPPNMTIDKDSGKIEWMPRTRGSSNVTVLVSDGMSSVYQSFTVLVPNKAPRITGVPPLNATTGAPYYYNVTAEDENYDALRFSLTSKIIGMEIGSVNGIIGWTPSYANDYDVVVVVSDGLASDTQEFTVKVSQGNRAPKFVSIPIKTATAGVPYTYLVRAMDEDNDGLSVSLVVCPSGMTLDSVSGEVRWTPAAAGNFSVILKVADGKGGDALQEFVINVVDRVKAKVGINRPSENEKVKGKMTVSGTATKGTLEVIGAQVRIDGGDWTDAAGNYTWQYSLDTTKLKNGKHLLEARAFDGKDYSDLAAVNFTVDNQKAQGKGFIPGFETGLLTLAVMFVVYLYVGRRRTKGGGRE